MRMFERLGRWGGRLGKLATEDALMKGRGSSKRNHGAVGARCDALQMNVLAIGIAATLACAFGQSASAQSNDASDTAFKLVGQQLLAGGRIPERFVADSFGCQGGNLSPGLSWHRAPEGTKSFVVTMYDPDAPTGSGWWHWGGYDIPASVTSPPPAIWRGGALPSGAKEAATDIGKPGYMGPCPPVGHKPHRYVFTVHAVKVESLGVP